MKKLCYPVREKILINDEECLEKWELIEKVGEDSTFGEIWTVCCDEKCSFVLKFLSYDNDNNKEGIIEEVNIQNYCAELDLCPKIADAWLCDEGGAIVMEIFQNTVMNLLMEYKSDVIRNIILTNIITMLDKLHYNGIYHGDAHLNNFMVKTSHVNGDDLSEEERYKIKDYKYYFIDFGRSGRIKDMSDAHIENDYKEVFDHLLELRDENPNDKGFKNLVKTMKIHLKKFD